MLSLKAVKATSRPLAPIGNHIARCVQVIDLGTQDSERWGPKHRMRLAWELSEELADFGKGTLEPFLVSMNLNLSLSQKSSLHKLLASWIPDEDLETFDLKRLVGAPCMVNVTHVIANERPYANVTSVTPVPAKFRETVPPLRNSGIFFEVEMGSSCREFLLLPDFLKEQISKCHEWRGQSGNGKEQQS